MDLENRNNDILIFISKVNFKIFKIPIKRGDKIYRVGKAKYQELAFKYWTLFAEAIQPQAIVAEYDEEVGAVLVESF